MVFHLAGFLGVGSGIANQIVSLIHTWGWGVIFFFLVFTFFSAGSFSVWSMYADYIVGTIETFLQENAWERAVAW